MQNSKNAKRSLNEAWSTGNAQNQYLASHTSDWGRPSNNQYSLLAINEGFEESYPSLTTSGSNEVGRMPSGYWQRAPVIRTGPKRKPKRRKIRAENTLQPTLSSTEMELGSGFAQTENTLNPTLPATRDSASIPSPVEEGRVVFSSSSSSSSLTLANSAQSEDNDEEDIALLQSREAAMQNLLNQLQDDKIEDIAHVTSAEESERFMVHLQNLATAAFGEAMDNPPPVSNPPQGNQKAVYLGYRGPSIQEFVFDYLAAKYFWKVKNPNKEEFHFHNKFASTRKMMAFAYNELHFSFADLMQPFGVMRMLMYKSQDAKPFARLFASRIEHDFHQSPGSVCHYLKMHNTFIALWFEWLAYAFPSSESLAAFKRMWDVQNLGPLIKISLSIAQRARKRNIANKGRERNVTVRINRGTEITLKQSGRYRELLVEFLIRLLTSLGILETTNDESEILFQQQGYVVCDSPFQKMLVKQFEVCQALVVYLMVLGGIGSQRPAIYGNLLDEEIQWQQSHLLIRTNRNKRHLTREVLSFVIFQEESVFALHLWQVMLQKASPRFNNARMANPYVNPHTRQSGTLLFHYGMPLYNRSSYGVIPNARKGRKWFSKLLSDWARVNFQEILVANQLPYPQTIFDMRKVCMTNYYRLWRWTKGRPPPSNNPMSLEDCLKMMANECDTSVEQLKETYIYVPLCPRFADQDQDVDPARQDVQPPPVSDTCTPTRVNVFHTNASVADRVSAMF